jgi:hypothetical protein
MGDLNLNVKPVIFYARDVNREVEDGRQ